MCVFQKSRAKLNKVTTSKVILIILLIYIALLTPFTIVIAFNGNTEPFTRVIEGAFALCTVAVGFYYWKAKAENLHKYKQDDKITME